ncbi:MAG: hypothetical protein AB7O67_18900 [Vicinamibacterales bacterium]
MAASRQQILLGALGVVLAGAMAWSFSGGPAPSAPGRAPARARPAAAGPASDAAPADVRLDALARDREPPLDVVRNPFRFGARTPAPSQAPAAGPAPGGATEPVFEAPPARPTGPPAAPPIALKFFGLVQRADGQRVAALTDGKTVWYGLEGDIIEGRYRILSIGQESIEVAYVDGRGRQTIRLTGQ